MDTSYTWTLHTHGHFIHMDTSYTWTLHVTLSREVFVKNFPNGVFEKRGDTRRKRFIYSSRVLLKRTYSKRVLHILGRSVCKTNLLKGSVWYKMIAHMIKLVTGSARKRASPRGVPNEIIHALIITSSEPIASPMTCRLCMVRRIYI